MRIALVHDWKGPIGGDVRVLDTLKAMYPDADVLYVSQKKPAKLSLPLMPFRAESLDLSDYDLVISTGAIFSKGLVLRPKTYHINYCHSPTRQVWDLAHDYRHRIFQHALRIWDRQASTRVDQFIANSKHVQERIKKFYKRDSVVIYPPVTPPLLPLNLRGGREGFLIVSRLYKHKNIDIAIKAFNKLGWPLVIIGDGPERERLARLAGPNVKLLGMLSDEQVSQYYQNCTAFIMPQEEDFGIAPVEAMMHGKPVLALRAGGALEYVQEGINGLFFDDPHEAVLADGVRRIRNIRFGPEKIKASVEQFSWQKFQSSFSNIISRIVR